MEFLSRALHPNITTHNRYLQDLSKKEMDKINNRDNVALTEKDRVGLNRQNVQTKIFFLMKDILKKELKNPNEIEIISNYDKNGTMETIFHYTVNYKNGNTLAVKYNSEANKFLINSNFLDKETASTIEKKLSNAMKNIDTLINAAADFEHIDVRVHKDRHSVLEITPLNESVRDENDNFLYEVSESYGVTYPENIYAEEKDFSITALVVFYDTDKGMYDQTRYGADFFAKEFGGTEVNKIDELASFVKVNTLINIFEQVKKGPFTEAINYSRNNEEFVKNSKKVTDSFLEFVKESGEKITQKDLMTYAKTKIAWMPLHGFQNIIENGTKPQNTPKNAMK